MSSQQTDVKKIIVEEYSNEVTIAGAIVSIGFLIVLFWLMIVAIKYMNKQMGYIDKQMSTK